MQKELTFEESIRRMVEKAMTTAPRTVRESASVRKPIHKAPRKPAPKPAFAPAPSPPLPAAASKRGAMTVAEAGRLGGLTVRDERGIEFYGEIGRKGGAVVRRAFGKDRKPTREKDPAAVALGTKGGRANAKKYGHDHYVAIGKLGGAKVREVMAARTT